MEPPEIVPPLQQIQQSTSVDLSPTLKEHPGSNVDGYRYPTRYSLLKKSYSMAYNSKYSYAAEQLAKTPAHPIHFKEHMACPVINPDTGVSLEYRHLIQGPDKDIWVKALANDFGRLAQGVKDIIPTGNSTIFFIHPCEIPTHKKVTYGRLVVDIRPLKEEKYRVRITVGGDKLYFCGDASSGAASLATVKILLNSVVSTKGEKNSQQPIQKIFSLPPF